jgi:uncharacterized integral membrane protein
LTGAPRSGAGVVRKIVAALVLVPLAVVIVAFAIANRQAVTVSLDPFNSVDPAYSKSMWLFVPILAALIIGVFIGGMVGWVRHGGWRRTARRLEGDVARLRAEIDAHKRGAGTPPRIPETADPPERLQLRAPVR